MALLAVISVLLIAFDFAHELNINNEPFKAVNNGILVFLQLITLPDFTLQRIRKSSSSIIFLICFQLSPVMVLHGFSGGIGLVEFSLSYESFG